MQSNVDEDMIFACSVLDAADAHVSLPCVSHRHKFNCWLFLGAKRTQKKKKKENIYSKIIIADHTKHVNINCINEQFDVRRCTSLLFLFLFIAASEIPSQCAAAAAVSRYTRA